MAYGLSNGHVTDDVTRTPKVLWGSTVGYPGDSLASCYCNCIGYRVTRPHLRSVVSEDSPMPTAQHLCLCLWTRFTSKLNILCCLFTNTHSDEKLFKMKVKKQSCSDNDDKLTIEDVVQLDGDQVGVILLSINIFTVRRHRGGRLYMNLYSH